VIIPVKNGDNVIETKSFKQKSVSHVSKMFDGFTTKTAILGTSHIMRKALQPET
jgi:hypothetical protein